MRQGQGAPAGSGAADPLSALALMVTSVRYKPGWTFKLGGPGGRFLCVFARTPNSLKPTEERTTQHMFAVPNSLESNRVTRWLLDCLLQVERHEACEFLEVGGFRPFFPHHQDEGDPYDIVERQHP